MEKNSFYLPIEVRASARNGKPTYVIKGRAVAQNIPHVYKTITDHKGNTVSFKSMFSKQAIKSIEEQLKHKNVYTDFFHDVAASLNVKKNIEKIKNKLKSSNSSANIDEELSHIMNNVAFVTENIPIIKPVGFEIDDKGIQLEVETNPHYRDVNPVIYDFLVNSCIDGYIDGMSINMGITKVKQENINGSIVDVIDDCDIFGVSLLGNAALGDACSITEVAMRGIQNLKEGDEKMGNEGNEGKTPSGVDAEKEELKKRLAELEAKEAERKKEEEIAKKLEEQKKVYEQQIKDTEEQLKAKQKEYEEVRSKLSSSQGRSVVVSVQKYQEEYGQTPMQTIQETIKSGALGLGQLIALQGEFKTNNALPPETRALLNSPVPPEMGEEIRVGKNR